MSGATPCVNRSKLVVGTPLPGAPLRSSRMHAANSASLAEAGGKASVSSSVAAHAPTCRPAVVWVRVGVVAVLGDDGRAPAPGDGRAPAPGAPSAPRRLKNSIAESVSFIGLDQDVHE